MLGRVMVNERKRVLSGPEKAVLFLLSLEEDVAGPIVNQLDIGDMRKLREVAATMHEVDTGAIDEVFREFVERSNQAIAVPRGGLPYLHRLAVGALGSQRAGEVFDPVVGGSSPLRRLEQAPPDAVAGLLENESPQLVAAIVARLDPQTAAAILAVMPPEREAMVLGSLGRMTDLPAGVLEDVASALSEELPSPDAETLVRIDGVAKVAEILNATSRNHSNEVLQALEGEEPDLARDVRLAMFTFDDLKVVDPRSMRNLLREVAMDKLTLALKDASPDVTSAIFGGLSERASKLIRDDLELLGRVRKSEVEAARQEVVQVALRLEAEGSVDLGREE
jgi:flagellar motor switch protein FliG